MSIISTPADAGGSVLDPIAATLKNPFSTTVSQKGDRPADFPGGFQIIEYINGVAQNGLNGAPNTIIRLVGNLMPMQPFAWEGEQRIVKDYYPGNPEAAAQVLGPKENDVTIHGRFKDKRYKDPSYYGVSYQYGLLCDAMRTRGNLIKFGMHGIAGDWFRWGFIEKSSFKMNKQSWVDYEITFSIVSTHQPINDYFSAPEKQAPSGVNANLINSANAFNSTYSTIPTSVPRSIADVMNGLISDVAKNINLVTNFVNSITSTIQSVEQSAVRALGLIKHVQTTLYEFQQTCDSITHAFSKNTGAGSAPTSVFSFYNAYAFILNASADTVPMQAYLKQMQAQFQAIAQQVPKARYKTVQKDTLQKISMKFYGVSDYWSNIQDHNHLQSTALTPGQILEIPNV